MTTLTEFHYFPRLPLEMQDMIWKKAIRPEVPEFHALCFEPHRPCVDTYLKSSGVLHGHNDDRSRRFWGKNRAHDWKVKAVIQAPRPLTDKIKDRDFGRLADNCWRQDDKQVSVPGGRWAVDRLHQVQNDHEPISPKSGALATKRSSSALSRAISRSRQANLNNRTECFSISHAPMWGVKNLAIEWEPWMRIDLELHGPSHLSRGMIGSYSPQWRDIVYLPDESATSSPIVHLIQAAQRWQDHGNQYPIDEAGVRVFWCLNRSIRRDHQWKAADNSEGGKTDSNKQRIIFHGKGIKLSEVRIGDEGWIASSLDPSHTCPVPDLLRNYTTPWNPGCGAHCGMRRLAQSISLNSSHPRVSPATALERLQTGPVRVLAVEYGNF
ncbi:hypothetical protein V8F33_013516 [Rhypophila sp. PSN 637]